MRKKLIAPACLALVLTGCSPSLGDAASSCGGEDAGISVKNDGVVEYDQDLDSSGDAWKCLLNQLVPDESAQYEITQGLGSPGTSGDTRSGGRPIVWGTSPDGAIRLFFNP